MLFKETFLTRFIQLESENYGKDIYVCMYVCSTIIEQQYCAAGLRSFTFIRRLQSVLRVKLTSKPGSSVENLLR